MRCVCFSVFEIEKKKARKQASNQWLSPFLQESTDLQRAARARCYVCDELDSRSELNSHDFNSGIWDDFACLCVCVRLPWNAINVIIFEWIKSVEFWFYLLMVNRRMNLWIKFWMLWEVELNNLKLMVFRKLAKIKNQGV